MDSHDPHFYFMVFIGGDAGEYSEIELAGLVRTLFLFVTFPFSLSLHILKIFNSIVLSRYRTQTCKALLFADRKSVV